MRSIKTLICLEPPTLLQTFSKKLRAKQASTRLLPIGRLVFVKQIITAICFFFLYFHFQEIGTKKRHTEPCKSSKTSSLFLLTVPIRNIRRMDTINTAAAAPPSWSVTVRQSASEHIKHTIIDREKKWCTREKYISLGLLPQLRVLAWVTYLRVQGRMLAIASLQKKLVYSRVCVRPVARHRVNCR